MSPATAIAFLAGGVMGAVGAIVWRSRRDDRKPLTDAGISPAAAPLVIPPPPSDPTDDEAGFEACARWLTLSVAEAIRRAEAETWVPRDGGELERLRAAFRFTGRETSTAEARFKYWDRLRRAERRGGDAAKIDEEWARAEAYFDALPGATLTLDLTPWEGKTGPWDLATLMRGSSRVPFGVEPVLGRLRDRFPCRDVLCSRGILVPSPRLDTPCLLFNRRLNATRARMRIEDAGE